MIRPHARLQSRRCLADLQPAGCRRCWCCGTVVETPGSRSAPAVRGYPGRGTVHIASLQDVLDATLAAVSAASGCREEHDYVQWLHEVCVEGAKLAREEAY